MGTVTLLLGMLVLLLLQGFFSGAEIAIVNSDRGKLRHRAKQGDQGAKLALRLLEQPEVVLSTTLVGTNVALVLLTSLATASLIILIGDEGDLYAALLLIPITLIFGEVVPKSVFQQRADELTPRIIYPLYACSLILFPVIFFFSRTAKMVARFVGNGGTDTNLFVLREQLRAILDTAEGGATIDVFDAARIRNVVRFGEYVVGDIMVPAAEMPAVAADADLASVAALLRESGQERIPVFEGERSHVKGIIALSIWDVMQPGFADKTIHDFIRPAYFVPVQHPLVELLPVLRARYDQAAVVVDEYGSAVGMVSVDDILASVVGRVTVGTAFARQDTSVEPQWQDNGDGTYTMDARLTIADLNDVLGTQIGSSEARTIGGLLVARLRHVPTTGESIEESGFRFTVTQATERAVTRLRVEPLENRS